MPYCKKIVILNSLKNNNLKGVLSLEQNGVKLKCVLKTYGEDKLNNLVVGIKVNGNLLSPINVLAKKSDNFEFELNNNLDLANEVCALVNEKNEFGLEPILYGGSEPKQSVIAQFNNEVVNYGEVGVVPKKVEIKTTLDEVANATLFSYSDEEVEAVIDKELENFEVKTEKNDITTKSNFLKATSESNNEPIFYTLVEEQVAKMFETYPADQTLSELLPNSRFAKIDFDGEGLYYSLGLLYGENGNVEKICYAVKARIDQKPPEDIKDYCFYLPSGESEGYFVLLQDAKTGENIGKDFI